MAGVYDFIIAGEADYYDITFVNATYTIHRANLSDTTINFVSDGYVYAGSSVEPTFNLEYMGHTLSSDEYTVYYTDNECVGTGIIRVSTTNHNFAGIKTIFFIMNVKTQKTMFMYVNMMLMLNINLINLEEEIHIIFLFKRMKKFYL